VGARIAMTRAERLEAWHRTRSSGPPSAADLAYRDAHPMQTCPDCGVTEAAGPYCSGCLLPMGPADWHPLEMSDAQRAGLAAARQNRRSGRSRRRDAA
jgi:hypothetical protein